MKKYILFIITMLIIPTTIFAEYELERQDIYDYKEFFDDLYPVDSGSDSGYSDACGGSKSYMWPIGSDQVTNEKGVEMATGEPNTVYISSTFGATESGIHDYGHGGLDIAPAAAAGVVNVIAAQSGEVISAYNGCVSFGDYSCGGSYGNHIVIKSNDGNYQYYGHLHQNTIKVKAGDKVVQGQVIGKVGSSGHSTGTHLHFEVREGQDEFGARVDPLNYVDPEKPRPSGSGGTSDDDCFIPLELLDWVRYFEGGVEEGDYYVAYDGGDGVVWTIGPGITPHEVEAFRLAGVDPSQIYVGSRVPKADIDRVYLYAMQLHRKSVEKILSDNGVTLNNNQILALTSSEYNGGAGFTYNVIDGYKKYGYTYKLSQSFCEYVHGNGITWPGLIKRRKSEWLVFTSGIYTTHDQQGDDGNIECIGNFNVPNDEKSKLAKIVEETAKGFGGTIHYY